MASRPKRSVDKVKGLVVTVLLDAGINYWRPAKGQTLIGLNLSWQTGSFDSKHHTEPITRKLLTIFYQ